MKHQEADMALCPKKGPVRFLKNAIERKMVALSRVHSLAISDADVLLRTKEAREAVAGWYTYPKHSDTAQVSHMLCLGSVSRWHWTRLPHLCPAGIQSFDSSLPGQCQGYQVRSHHAIGSLLILKELFHLGRRPSCRKCLGRCNALQRGTAEIRVHT